jgi:hypothetical protein
MTMEITKIFHKIVSRAYIFGNVNDIDSTSDNQILDAFEHDVTIMKSSGDAKKLH